MLSNKVIIYDDSCPMCKLYTYWFVAWGFLGPENRVGFATAPDAITMHLDLERGRHEIPLYDRSTHETIYGLDALTFLLGSRWTWLKPIFKSKLFYWLFHPVYEIITYNRRVIAGCQACCGFDCAPDLNRFYRSVYLGIAGSIVGAITIALAASATATLMATMAAIFIMALLIFGMAMGCVNWFRRGEAATWDFAGNYATILLMVAIALTPMLMVANLSQSLAVGDLTFTALLGVWEMLRRRIW